MAPLYRCPSTGELLEREGLALRRADGLSYPLLSTESGGVPNFLEARPLGKKGEGTLESYDQGHSAERYRNFLDWLFETFAADEAEFRRALIDRLCLPPGGRVLITGCGLGDDLAPAIEALGGGGEVYATDLAPSMVLAAEQSLRDARESGSSEVHFAVCDAAGLPFSDDYFDGAFHFGGINIFDDIPAAIAEMDRVVRPGGRVVFGDEGVAPWLRETDYGRMAIKNIPLWASAPPLEVLPRNALDVSLSWVLGNCFYVLEFEVSAVGPHMNPDVRHEGLRGGTMRSRYYGELEGVSPESKAFVFADAARRGLSVHEWLEEAIRAQREPQGQ